MHALMLKIMFSLIMIMGWRVGSKNLIRSENESTPRGAFRDPSFDIEPIIIYSSKGLSWA